MQQTDPTTPRPQPRAPRPRRWLRRFIILLGVLLLLISGISYLTSPARLNRVLVKLLQDSIGCDATIGKATLSWDGLLVVDGIKLTVPDTDGQMAQLLTTDRVVVQLRLWPLLIGQVRAASVAISHPTLYLTEDLDRGRFNFEMLIARPPGESSSGSSLPKALPEVYLNSGEVHFGQLVADAYQPAQSLRVDGTLSADPDRSGGYFFILSQRDDPANRTAGTGTTIQGEIDLHEPGVEVQLDRFTFNGPYRNLLPHAVRKWWDRLSPIGAVPRVVFSARHGGDNSVVMAAQMTLDGIGLSLPLESDKPLMLTGVTGEITMASNVVSFEKITGDIEGVAFNADGRIDGLDTGAPFSIALTTQPFDVPAEGGVWDKLPPYILKYRDRFSPTGRYQAQVVIGRDTPGGELTLGGYLDLIDTTFAYNKFPYPAEKLSGRITFDEDRIVLNDLVGVAPSGGTGTVSGTIGPPIRNGAVDITIHGEGIPIDEYLLSAMKPKHRDVIDMFFSQRGYEELLKAGVIRGPGEPAVDAPQRADANQSVAIQSEVPVFEPGGTADVTVRIQRSAGSDQPYLVTTDLDVAGLRSVFDFWRYPLVVEQGRVVISPDQVGVYGVHIKALNGGGGIVQGRLELPDGDQPLKPYLQITSIHLPVDDLLIASIPPPKDHWVRSLQLSGELVGTGEVFADRGGKVAFTVDTQLQNGSARPNGGAYLLQQITGGVTVERTRVQFENLVSRHEGGTISLNGQTDFGEGGLGVDLDFTGDQLAIEPGLIDLLPLEHEGRPVMRELFADYRPDGTIDAELRYHGGGGEPDRFTLGVTPEAVGFDYAGQRIELSDLTGHIELTPSRAQMQKVSGRFASGSFQIDGEVRLGEDKGVALSFNVDAQRVDPTARALLPAGVLSLVDRLAIQGPYTVDDAHLLSWPDAVQGPTRIFEGKVNLKGATAQLGVPVTELDAELDMRVATFVDQPYPHTDMHIHAERLRAADRLVQRFSLAVATGDRPWLVNLSDLKGTVYGGALVGFGQLSLGEPSSLGIDLTLHDVELEPFLNPLQPDTSAEIAPSTADVNEVTTRDMSSGLLSAGLSIRVPLDDPTQRQGRGVVSVRDAKLYDRPLTLALLQAANFALPNESSFDRAAARYLIFGDTVVFDDIRFEAPAFVIAGTGTMEYPSTNLNLRMATSNPAAPDLGAVSDLVRTFKDGLLGIEVHGTLAKPEARVVPLEGLFRSWDRVFGQTRAPLTVEQPVKQ
ncbi:MAG: hypothetical protein R3C45_06385 [Phycisphaerales bacterium]